MRIPIYQIDAFTDEQFKGNPAAVCPLEAWISDTLMQKIAAENNLSETAFFVKEGSDYALRWFTPKRNVSNVLRHLSRTISVVHRRYGNYN